MELMWCDNIPQKAIYRQSHATRQSLLGEFATGTMKFRWETEKLNIMIKKSDELIKL